jgi:outer membrane protein OmpA-like peptidoglycan-associated protein
MQNIGIKLFDGSLYAVGDIYSVQGAEVVVTTIADDQRIAEVELYLIDEKRLAGSPFIGKFTIRDIPEEKAGSPRFTLIIKADKSANLNVLVYDKGKLSGTMDIHASGWHPDYKSKSTSQVRMQKKDKVSTRDFEVLFKSEKEAVRTEASGKPVLPTVPKEEKTHTLPKDDDSKKKPAYAGVLLGVLAAVAAIIVIALVIFKPWAETSSSGVNTAMTNLVPSDSGKSNDTVETSSLAEPTQETEASPTPRAASITPVPTIEPAVLLAEINSKIDNIGTIYFEPDSVIILSDSTSKLALLAAILREHKGPIRVDVTGHTAQIGTTGEQAELSVERAKLIAEEMIARGAIDRDAISWSGVGATRPATTDTRRIELNRRVEIVASMK